MFNNTGDFNFKLNNLYIKKQMYTLMHFIKKILPLP